MCIGEHEPSQEGSVLRKALMESRSRIQKSQMVTTGKVAKWPPIIDNVQN
ncbi:hypothetical protein TIFTF001_019848 [Ficus carica]|uniref:Uncharacterized protein n=1 Tax=Ficus carica TaxID=3494 RepID=A0AA88A7E1_FICCA|nr:hypothetical protein TIFTF001_019848 [Ficus carica]